MTLVPDRATLIFDGTCDFCTRSVRLIRWLDRKQRLTTLPFQGRDVPERHGLTVAQCETAAWTVTPDGRRVPGAGAINLALSAALGLPIFWWVYRLPGVGWLQDRVYAWIARNRSRFPGDAPYCEQFPRECQ